MYNIALKAGFQLKNYSNLNTPLFFEKEKQYFFEDEYFDEKIKLKYFRGKITDLENNFQIANKETFINYLSIDRQIVNLGFVYFIKIGNIFKIGSTNNLLKRINQINQVNFTNIEYFTYFVTENHELHEKKLHKMYKEHQTKGEKHRLRQLSLPLFQDYQRNIIKDSLRGLTLTPLV
jgi:hypothetical protein